MSTTENTRQIDVQLSDELQQMVEAAAAALGQTVGEFTTAVILREARAVMRDACITQLSDRDRDKFLAAIEDESLQPNDALVNAAQRYQEHRQ